MFENQNRENMEIKEFFLNINLPLSIRWFRNGIHSLLSRVAARRSHDII